MAITTRDQLINAMCNNSSRIVVDKASISNAVAGQFHSLWRATGQPGQGAIPAAAALCNNVTTGCLGFTQQTDPATSYLAILEGLCGNSASTLEIHDRLMAMGGMSGIVATAQTASVDLYANLANENIAARIGADDYGDVTWWLEWYSDTGSSVVTATVNVTYNDGSTGNLTAVSLAATRRASFMQPLNSLIPAGTAKFIRAVNTVTLSATTGTAGSFGVTATRYRAALYKPVANARFTADWASLGIPKIPNKSCLILVQVAGTTSTGAVRATGKIIHG